MSAPLKSGYFEAHLRKQGIYPAHRSDNDKLITDRAAYISFLEAQLERLAAACEHVDAQATKLAAQEQQIAAQTNHISEMQEKLVSMTQLIQMVQAYSERQGKEAGLAVANLHAALQHASARADAQAMQLEGAHSANLALNSRLDSESSRLDAVSDRVYMVESACTGLSARADALDARIESVGEGARSALERDVGAAKERLEVLATRLEAGMLQVEAAASASDGAALAAGRAADAAAAAEATALSARDVATSAATSAVTASVDARAATERADEAVLLSSSAESCARATAQAAVRVMATGHTGLGLGMVMMASPSFPGAVASAALGAGDFALAHSNVHPPPTTLSVTRSVEAAVATVLQASAAEIAAVAGGMSGRLSEVEAAGRRVAHEAVGAQEAVTRLREGEEVREQALSRRLQDLEVRLSEQVSATIASTLNPLAGRLEACEGVVQTGLAALESRVGDMLARREGPMPMPGAGEGGGSALDDSLSDANTRRPAWVDAVRDVQASLGAQLAELAVTVAGADSEFRAILSSVQARMDAVDTARERGVSMNLPAQQQQREAQAQGLDEIRSLVASAEATFRAVAGDTVRTCASIADSAIAVVRRAEGLPVPAPLSSPSRPLPAGQVPPHPFMTSVVPDSLAKGGGSVTRVVAAGGVGPGTGRHLFTDANASASASAYPSPVRPAWPVSVPVPVPSSSSAVDSRITDVLSGLATLTREVHCVQQAMVGQQQQQQQSLSTSGFSYSSTHSRPGDNVSLNVSGGAGRGEMLKSRGKGLVLRPVRVSGGAAVRGQEAPAEAQRAPAPVSVLAPVSVSREGMGTAKTQSRPGTPQSSNGMGVAIGGGGAGGSRRPSSGSMTAHVSMASAGPGWAGPRPKHATGISSNGRGSRSGRSSPVQTASKGQVGGVGAGLLPAWYADRAAEIAQAQANARQTALCPFPAEVTALEGGVLEGGSGRWSVGSTGADSVESTAVHVLGRQLCGQAGLRARPSLDSSTGSAV